MNKKEYEECINALQNEINSLKEELNQIQDEIPDYPVFDNERSWIMTVQLESLNFGITKCNADNIFPDFNLFHEKYFADEFAEKCKMIAMLLHCKWYCDRDLITDFSDESVGKWCVWYDHHSNRWTIDCQQTYENTTIYFTTAEAARKAADWMNEHFKFS